MRTSSGPRPRPWAPRGVSRAAIHTWTWTKPGPVAPAGGGRGGDPYVDGDEAGTSAPPPPVPFDDRFDQPLHAVVDEPPPLPGDAVEDAPPPPPPDSVPLDPTALRAVPGEPELAAV